MKLPSKYIALLVVLSLAGIFAYQAYWLTGLYRTMRTDLERNITEAMRISDYNEMLVRIELMQRRNKEHGEISVSAGYGNKGEKIVQSNTTFHTSPGDTTTHTRVDTLYQSATADTTMSDAMIHSKDGLDILLRDHNSITNMAAYIQRGMHSGLDIFIEPSFATYDSLLNARLREMDIDIRYRLQYLYSGYDAYDRWLYTDTLATGGTPGYIPGPDAVSYQYAFSSSEHDVYRLTTEPLGNLVLRQMAGILTTSLVILLILGFSFWYLIRTILRQKTLEEMKSDFTNNITHELKTPIAVAYAATDALLNFHQADDPGKRERYLRICQEQLGRLGGLVEQILSMSMERRKTFRLRLEEIRLADLLPSLVELHKLKADKPVHITLDIVPENLTVTADRTHLANIVSNLLDNAVKYSRDRADVMMPRMDGFEMVRRIRQTDRRTPVLFLTARSAVNDVVEGFELGANDYLKKPFGMQELIVRIKALMGRACTYTQPAENEQTFYEIGHYQLDTRRQLLLHEGLKQELSHREAEILRRLCQNRNCVVSMRDILLDLWGDDSFFNQRSLHVFITKLRHKLAKDEHIRIINVRGVGYKLITE